MIFFGSFWQKNVFLFLVALDKNKTKTSRVSVQGDKSLGGHFACLCQGFDFYEVKKNEKFLFEKENGNTITLLIIIIVKSLQKEQIAQITQYEP